VAETTSMMDERLREEATRAGRAELDHALRRVTASEREAFWNAIGLYYSTRRHPGADEPRTAVDTVSG